MSDRLISTRRIGGLIAARLMLLSIVLSVLTACSTVSYYEQAVRGHLGLVVKSTSINRLIATDQVGARTRERLMWEGENRRIAVKKLGLPDKGSYTR